MKKFIITLVMSLMAVVSFAQNDIVINNVVFHNLCHRLVRMSLRGTSVDMLISDVIIVDQIEQETVLVKFTNDEGNDTIINLNRSNLNVRNSICSNNLKKFLNNKFSATHIKSVRVIGNDGNFKDFNLDGVVYEARKIKSKAEDERREKVRNAINSFK